MFTLLGKDGYNWINFNFRAPSFIEYEAKVGQVFHLNQIEALFFPLQWTRACLSLGSSKTKLVVDEQVLVDMEYKKDEDANRPANLNLRLGFFLDQWGTDGEYVIKTAELNVFKSSLSVERMIGMTTAGGDECGAPGDLVNWEEAEWTLYSQAKMIEVDREWEGPCRRESQVHVFTAAFNWHHHCMHHCQKISGGRSPPVTTKEEWENLTREIDLITGDRSVMPWMWLSATEGDKDSKLARLDHWPETDINGTRKLEAVETIWRDFYTGQRMDNWTKPYYHQDTMDTTYGDTFNCIFAFRDVPWHISWYEFQ